MDLGDYLGLWRPEEKREKAFNCQETGNAARDYHIHGQDITIFSRAHVYRCAETKEPINQFPAALFSQ
jgi:hypothetical protein